MWIFKNGESHKNRTHGISRGKRVDELYIHFVGWGPKRVFINAFLAVFSWAFEALHQYWSGIIALLKIHFDSAALCSAMTLDRSFRNPSSRNQQLGAWQNPFCQRRSLTLCTFEVQSLIWTKKYVTELVQYTILMCLWMCVPRAWVFTLQIVKNKRELRKKERKIQKFKPIKSPSFITQWYCSSIRCVQ